MTLVGHQVEIFARLHPHFPVSESCHWIDTLRSGTGWRRLMLINRLKLLTISASLRRLSS
jgi:hypothetical protein